MFPVVGAGAGAQLAVSVRSLPRTEEIPTVICAHTLAPQAALETGSGRLCAGVHSSPDSETETDEAKLGIAGALSWREGSDLRRSLVKSKLASSDLDCPGRLTKSDSMDSMLGDSLLDPPPSLAKMTPRRYQSPSRCGSPSLEAPEPLMTGFRGQAQPPSYDQAMAMRGSEPEDARLNRHDLLRRRDLTLFHGGLHPRLFHNHQRLSLPRPPAQPPGLPCRAVQPPVLADTLPVRCTISGKHICHEAEEEDGCTGAQNRFCTSDEAEPSSSHHRQEELCRVAQNQFSNYRQEELSSGAQNRSSSYCQEDLRTGAQNRFSSYRQEELGAKAKGWSSRLGRTSTPYSRDSSSDSSSAADQRRPRCRQSEEEEGCTGVQNRFCTPVEDMGHGEIEDVLSYLKTRRSPLSSSKDRSESSIKDIKVDLLSCKSSRRPSFEDLKPSSSITQVYRTELSNNNFVQVNQKPDKTNLFLEAILRPQLTEGGKIAPGIHTLRETTKYCSQSSSNDVSPLTPVQDQFFPETINNNDVPDLPSPGCDPHPLLSPRSPSPEDAVHDSSVGDLCQDLQSKCLITKKGSLVKRSLSPYLSDLSVRVRSLSENCHNIREPGTRMRPVLQPLDFSFEECDDSWSATGERLNDNSGFVIGDKRRKSLEEEEGCVPSANKKNAFRKSFDSAASMVFQRRTGLPLTSSPAPMRRGVKFDFDSGIATPKDIKRALFEPQSPEESECGSPKKKKRDPRRLLSTSAPAGTISNNNLLCNFEAGEHFATKLDYFVYNRPFELEIAEKYQDLSI